MTPISLALLDLLFWPFRPFWTLGLEAYLLRSASNSRMSRFCVLLFLSVLAIEKKQRKSYGIWYLLVSCRAHCTSEHNAQSRMHIGARASKAAVSGETWMVRGAGGGGWAANYRLLLPGSTYVCYKPTFTSPSTTSSLSMA